MILLLWFLFGVTVWAIFTIVRRIQLRRAEQIASARAFDAMVESYRRQYMQ